MFFAFDGVDGAGKSTQIARFVGSLEARGRAVTLCRDPGGTELGEAIRELLLGHRHAGMALPTEALLYMAARAQLVAEVIRPALDAGRDVVCDRFLLSNVVYQGHAGGLEPENLWTIGRTATGGLLPDLTFVLDLPAELAWQRLGGQADRIESRGVEFQQRVRAGFLAEAQRDPGRIKIIDAQGSEEDVAARVIAAAMA
ncbi:MAG: dTMP kinase [Pirellulales bacterium]